MLKETAVSYYMQGYNCAESLVNAADELWHLGLNEQGRRLAAGLGGGVQMGEVCGALTGAICALGCLIVETKAHDCAQLKPMTLEIAAAVKEKIGFVRCDEIKPRMFTMERRCAGTVEVCAEILESVLQEYGITPGNVGE